MSYALVRLSDEAVLRRYEALPGWFEVPIMRWGRQRWKRIKSPAQLGDEWKGYRLVEVVRNEDQPGPYYRRTGQTSELDDNTLTITATWAPWKQAEIDAAEAQEDEEAETALAQRKLVKALYRLAKGPHRPDLTPAQFKAWLEGL